MDKRIFRYSDFRAEARLQMVLEAKIRYEHDFVEVLGRIDSRIAKELQALAWDKSGEEVDVITNYIDVVRKKDDMVSFKPDEKVAKEGESIVGKAALATSPGARYDLVGDRILKDKNREPARNQRGVVEREISEEELGGGWGFVYPYSTLVVFMWRDQKGEGRCVFDKRNLTMGPEAVKPSEIGVGRLVRGILSNAGVEFSDSEIEDFVYKYRAEVAKLNDEMKRFRIASGTEIRKAYLHESYEAQTGTLGNSCMRYSSCQGFFGIYEENQDVCSLVVLDSREKEGKICGRALLWTDSEGRKIMDRIYVNRPQDERLFKEFAMQSGFFHKETQNMEENPFVSPDGKVADLSAKIMVKGYFYKYPYLDTFKYYRESNGPSNEGSYLTNDYENRYDYTLTDTEGGNGDSCEMCGGEQLECPECYGNGDHRCERCDGEGELECGACGNARERDCDSCDGSGEDSEGNECGECSGSGTHTCEECGGEPIECGECGGEGRIECEFCGGNGDVPCPECG